MIIKTNFFLLSFFFPLLLLFLLFCLFGSGTQGTENSSPYSPGIFKFPEIFKSV